MIDSGRTYWLKHRNAILGVLSGLPMRTNDIATHAGIHPLQCRMALQWAVYHGLVRQRLKTNSSGKLSPEYWLVHDE